jgi:hypothetical protein
VAHACHPSYSGGRDDVEDRGLRPAWANSSRGPISKIPITKKKAGVAQGLGPEFKSRYWKKKNKTKLTSTQSPTTLSTIWFPLCLWTSPTTLSFHSLLSKLRWPSYCSWIVPSSFPTSSYHTCQSLLSPLIWIICFLTFFQVCTQVMCYERGLHKKHPI